MVGECFAINLASIQPKMAEIQIFCDYLIETYIDDDSDFPPEIWATCSFSMYLKTVACESFHSKCNSLFYTSYPCVYAFFEIVKQYQTDAKIKIQSIVCTLRKPLSIFIKKKLYKPNYKIKKLGNNSL